jgi:hypothetical protein
MDAQKARSFATEPLTTRESHSRCANPFCKAVIEPLEDGHWRRTRRRSCSDRCKMDCYVIRRAKEMLNKVEIVRFNAILEGFPRSR